MATYPTTSWVALTMGMRHGAWIQLDKQRSAIDIQSYLAILHVAILFTGWMRNYRCGHFVYWNELPVINMLFLLRKVWLAVILVVVGITTCTFWYSMLINGGYTKDCPKKGTTFYIILSFTSVIVHLPSQFWFVMHPG